ncbi:hypothetical protein LOK49_LG14G01206 [Camellia lanceoleosa]|uniref:Uncharacterized protein n=1 Tax=Camellia lanceoleosa TaxID=1840588 RepID=A0ACC0FB15_9ERIC|nr:hypothetical protein LOK49_LG14G01206 [Camellia lanceoleosa]
MGSKEMEKCVVRVVLAEKGHFDVSKDLFTQVQEAASGSVFVQMPDVWINLAHVYFAQGNFPLAVKMYQNCLRKFYYSTDSQVLLYLARTHYEFDAGVAMQKFSASTLQKQKRTVDEVYLDSLSQAPRSSSVVVRRPPSSVVVRLPPPPFVL